MVNPPPLLVSACALASAQSYPGSLGCPNVFLQCQHSGLGRTGQLSIEFRRLSLETENEADYREGRNASDDSGNPLRSFCMPPAQFRRRMLGRRTGIRSGGLTRIVIPGDTSGLNRRVPWSCQAFRLQSRIASRLPREQGSPGKRSYGADSTPSQEFASSRHFQADPLPLSARGSLLLEWQSFSLRRSTQESVTRRNIVEYSCGSLDFCGRRVRVFLIGKTAEHQWCDM